MSTTQAEQKPESAFLTLRIIHLAFISSIAVYGFIILGPGKSLIAKELMPEETARLLLYALGGMGAAMGLGSLGLRTVLLEQKKLVSWALAPLSSPGQVEEEASSLEEGKLITRYLAMNIVLMAIAETPAIFGLVLFFVSGNQNFALGLVGASLIVLLFHTPRKERLSALLKALEFAKLTRGESRASSHH